MALPGLHTHTPEARSRVHAGGLHQPHARGTVTSSSGQPLPVLRPGWTFCKSKRSDSPIEGELLVSHTSNLSPNLRPLCQACLLLSEGSHTLAVFIDSGSDINIIDEELTRQLNIQRVPLPHPSLACALDGHLVGTVTHQTTPLRLLLFGNHYETIQFHILKSPRLPFILGFPWLRRHNPTIDWSTGSILGWSPACHQVCLKQASAPRLITCSDPAPNMVGVPGEYSARLRPTPYLRINCAIDLQLGSSPPRGHLFSLSAPERKAMEEYIGDSLAAGIIRPSSSPAGAGFFFMEKKDKTLHPCIDYRGLNEITVKNRYPLPLISSAFELLQGSTVFSKLDLCYAYHLRYDTIR